MFKKIFINFLMLFVLASFSWAGVYKGKFTAEFGNGHPDNFVFTLEEIQNDLGLEIEFYNDITDFMENPISMPDSCTVYNTGELFLLIKNSDFSVIFKDFTVVTYSKNSEGQYNENYLGNGNVRLIDLKNSTFNNSIKEKANNAISFGRYTNYVNSNTFSIINEPREFYFMIEDPDINVNQQLTE